ncbi:MAG: choice-of-anchor D domain-containing protein [Myxococcales bacterium]|nr:choice-of-anchor D domain-containing protein [Myxococcales bacterium]
MRARVAVGAWALLLVVGCGGSAPSDPGPQLEVTPPVLELGVVRLGAAARRRLVLRNLADRRRSLEVWIGGELATDLTVDAAPAALLAMNDGAVDLVFRPQVVGTRLGSLFVEAEGAAPVEVSVAGTGARSALRVTPEVLDVGAALLGTPVTATVALHNEGAVPIRVVAVGREGTSAFTATLDGALELVPGARGELQVVFRPQFGGLHEGRMYLVEDDPDADTTYFRVRGEGLDSLLEASPTSLDFAGTAVGTTRARSVEVRNVGAAPLELLAPVLVPADAPFVVTPDQALPATLGSGEAIALEVGYRPTGARANTAALNLWEAGGGWAQVFLTGYGRTTANAEVRMPSRIDFGEVPVGVTARRGLVVENRGAASADLVALFPAPGGPFGAVLPLPVGFRLVAGAWHAADLTWTPEAPGPVSARLALHTTDPQHSEVAVEVVGRGVSTGPSRHLLVRDELAFGFVPRGRHRTGRVSLLSVGSDPVVVEAVALLDDAGGRLSLTPGAWPLVLAPGARAAVQVGFLDPLGALGPSQGVLQILTDVGAERVTVTATTALSEPTVNPLVIRAEWDPGRDAQVILHLVRSGGEAFDVPDDVTACRPGADLQGFGVSYAGYDEGPGWAQVEVYLQDAPQDAVYVHHAGGAQSVDVLVTATDGEGGVGAAQRVIGPGELWRAGIVDVLQGTFEGPGRPEPSPHQDCY